MKLGFLTAPLPQTSLEDLVKWGANCGFQTIEVACWPTSYEDRRYAGTQHIDVDGLTSARAEEIKGLLEREGMEISALAYYPNPLHPQEDVRREAIDHLKKVIQAADLLDVGIVGTFVGRDREKDVEGSLRDYERIFPEIVDHAEEKGVKLAIENCPMLYEDRWPGGDNLAYSPAIWREMFERIPSDHLGLNFDPSHLIWQQIDYVKAVGDFGEKIFHVHAKDTKILPQRLNEVGIYGFDFYEDKVAGLGDIDWQEFIGALYDVGYEGAVSIEQEDRNWEEETESVKRAISLARKCLRQYIV